MESAQRNQQLKLFAESLLQLEEIAFEDFNMPLIYLLQIRNLANLNRGLEMKRLLQKFLLFYPFYAEGHEMMGDVYAREENIELALNFYEKALLIAQSKGLGDKIKKVRDLLDKSKNKPEAQKNDAFFDITEAVIQNEERIIGRGKELRQMIEILISNSKRNLLLIGERGVGKSTLVRLLAQKIIFGEVPPALKEKKIKEINFVSPAHRLQVPRPVRGEGPEAPAGIQGAERHPGAGGHAPDDVHRGGARARRWTWSTSSRISCATIPSRSSPPPITRNTRTPSRRTTPCWAISRRSSSTSCPRRARARS